MNLKYILKNIYTILKFPLCIHIIIIVLYNIFIFMHYRYCTILNIENFIKSYFASLSPQCNILFNCIYTTKYILNETFIVINIYILSFCNKIKNK